MTILINIIKTMKYKEKVMKNFTVTESTNEYGAKIVVIGVGGGGSNMIEQLVNSDIAKNVKLVTINTDAQALDHSKAPHKVQIGKKLTKGLGAGMNPDIGRRSALEDYDEIKKMLTTF